MTTKALVFAYIKKVNGNVDLDALTKAVFENRPASKWQQSHWDYYRSGITSPNGRYAHVFSEEIKVNLVAGSRRMKATSSSPVPTRTRRSGGKHWPVWSLPSEDDQLLLAKALLPFVKLLSPDIVAAVVADNNRNRDLWSEQFAEVGISLDSYLWDDAPVTFPGVRRHVGGKEVVDFRTRGKLATGENALCLDDNSYPKQVWSFALRNAPFPMNNPPGYSLAHILDHKDFATRNADELLGHLPSAEKNRYAGLYTSCVNAVYVPTNFIKPTDHNSRIRLLLMQIVDRYYSSVCKPLPENLSLNLENISKEWRLDNFPKPQVVGNLAYVQAFLDFRNMKINELVKSRREVLDRSEK